MSSSCRAGQHPAKDHRPTRRLQKGEGRQTHPHEHDHAAAPPAQKIMNPLYEEVLPGGAMWSMRIPHARELRLTALGPGADVSALFFNAINPIDRLNIPDTLKALHTAKLTRGHVLMSDMGCALASIVDDSLGGTTARGTLDGRDDRIGVRRKDLPGSAGTTSTATPTETFSSSFPSGGWGLPTLWPM